jgi:hypothetical protein
VPIRVIELILQAAGTNREELKDLAKMWWVTILIKFLIFKILNR